ncbi:hypothetical protein VOLCADRAFT_95922 [Volvox carteri f. nagariensis]|uniref:Uncharacterized protein n=1 Tax=Volvox carteri f. nagariensis TaxID=3068 RepID=D8U8Q5_VOLCA|nr:uncharacterized protein VOLCADRAFT_95922 [Volvox carteri f. nagariensis]EFJ43790.1 hypothetical protein VOLCADRAFT_95922 [Volvox carteri f. nagariensis]|eukprot:XP_002955036.1 hypothetical protein VOLCADRAFT_95922 [Volvox carteri f. nagariensis]
MVTRDADEGIKKLQNSNACNKTQCLEIIVLGTGAGTTYVYSKQPSSSFVVVKKGEPILLCDVGYGVTAACLKLVGRVPPNLYVSHNHGDHTGELPVVLAVESTRAATAGCQQPPHLYAHADVLAEVRQHRLRELKSTGKPLEDFAVFHDVPAGEGTTAIADSGLAIRPFRSRHSETCYGLVLYDGDMPVLGWTADSGFDEALYEQLSVAPVLLVDARANGSEEHAGFGQLERLGEWVWVAVPGRELLRRTEDKPCPPLLQYKSTVHYASLPFMAGKVVYVTGYGRQDEEPKPEQVPPGMAVARPGMRIYLPPCAQRS